MCEVPCIGFLERVVPGDAKNCVKMAGGDGGR